VSDWLSAWIAEAEEAHESGYYERLARGRL
jgi:hypothetical protein